MDLQMLEIRPGMTRELEALATKEEMRLIICTGNNYGHTVELIAPRHPETVFLLEENRTGGPNILSLHFQTEDAAYLAGVAATLFPHPKVGIIRESGGPWLEGVEYGFQNGFRSRFRSADIPVFTSLEELLNKGEDTHRILLEAGDYLQKREILSRTAKSGYALFIVGDTSCQFTGPLPLGIISIDLAEALRRIADDVLAKTTGDGNYDFDLGSSIIDLRVNPQIETLNSPEAREKLNETRSAITAGLIEIEQMGM